MERNDKSDPIEVEIVSDEETGQAGGDESAADDGAIQAELGRLQEEVERLRELYLRKLADFDNYRKRQERDLADFRKHANGELLGDCLPVIDNLERALGAPAAADDALRQGVDLVLRQLKDVLARYGLEEIDPIGSAFDPALHEAIQRQESAEVEQNTVVKVFQKGYALHERLLRPALVVVAVPTGSAPADGGVEADE